MLEQSAAVRERTVSPVELVEHYLSRISVADKQIAAFVTVTEDSARAAARDAEKLVMRSDADDLPPLHGVPMCFKDLTATAGVRTMFGSKVLAGNVPTFDADVVTLLRRAGTIGLGKTATSEFGVLLSCETLGPPTRNPWRTSLSAGGSSGGAGAAVAAGLAPAAQGSDGGGSLRVPAALCGLVGMKPTRGVVSHGPLHSGMFGLPINGPLGRTVADVAALLDAMAVPMPGEPHLPPPPPPEGSFLAALGRPMRPLRVGRHAQPLVAESIVDPEVLRVWEETSKLLDALGHEVIDIDPPFDPSVGPLLDQVFGVLAANPLSPEREKLLHPLTRFVRERASSVSAWTVLGMLGQLQNAARSAMRALADVDLVLTPTLARVSAPIGYFTTPDDPADQLERQREFSPFCSPYNLTGQPAVSLPMGWSHDGLPIGVMLAGQPGADATVLAVASALEADSPWSDRHPAMWF
ncbi:amidase [Streptosporangium sp. KLBMP 9127]|nr:amidase [Streptosporangium sp. KLBMP 9127]